MRFMIKQRVTDDDDGDDSDYNNKNRETQRWEQNTNNTVTHGT